MSKSQDEQQARFGSFAGPSGFPPQEPPKEINEEMPPETEKPPEGTEKKKKIILTAIILTAVLLLIFLIVKIAPFIMRQFGQSSTTEQYITNDFVITKAEARLFAREYASNFTNQQEYYDKVYTEQPHFDTLAPILAENSMAMNDLKIYEPVIALYYYQNAEISNEINVKIQIKDSKSNTCEKTYQYSSLPSSGIIYIGTDEIVTNVQWWHTGEYMISLFIDDKIAYQYQITVTS